MTYPHPYPRWKWQVRYADGKDDAQDYPTEAEMLAWVAEQNRIAERPGHKITRVIETATDRVIFKEEM